MLEACGEHRRTSGACVRHMVQGQSGSIKVSQDYPRRGKVNKDLFKSSKD